MRLSADREHPDYKPEFLGRADVRVFLNDVEMGSCNIGDPPIVTANEEEGYIERLIHTETGYKETEDGELAMERIYGRVFISWPGRFP